MNFSKISTIALSVLFIAGCSDPPPPQKTFADPLLKQKQRAVDVQQTIDESAQRNRDAVDKQERGDSSQ
jgi:PBP1b-binding outer membrane lipoprotein LpoB